MFVPRKPHPMGNEYHSICCGESGIMYAIELVEGKDEPREKPADDTAGFSRTTSLLLRLCRRLYGTGSVVILDSGFCVLEALCELRKRGVFSSAVIKKRRYWPKHVSGDAMDAYMNANYGIGECNAITGVLNGTNYNLFAMKDVSRV
jgi:hypothetical protein